MSNTKYQPVSHFFVDHDALCIADTTDINDVEADAFGPVASNPTTKYRTTSFVKAENPAIPVKIFAICDGRILIQPVADDITKVNLILKPDTSYAPVKIKYFIYRGVNKEDLILNSETLTPVDESNTFQPEFLKELWKIFEQYNASIPDTPVPVVFPPYKIGYDPSNPQEELIDAVFNQSAGDDYQLPPCKAGMHLGYFTGRTGLDIVLDDGDYQLEHQEELFKFDLEYAQKSEHIFDVSTISNSNPTIQSTYQARYREYILRFMDAAAFWGSHINCGTIKLENDVTIKNTEDIYTNILNKYQTRHNIYIHIMEEKGRSYSYYDDPNNKRKISFEIWDPLNVSNPSFTDYGTFNWPIFIKQYNSSQGTNTIVGHLEYEIDNLITNQMQRFTAINVVAPVLASQKNPIKEQPATSGKGTGKQFVTCITFDYEDKICSSFSFITCNCKQTFPFVNYFNELWLANIKPTFTLSDDDNLCCWCNYDRSRIVNFDDVLSTGAVIQNKVVFDTGKNTNLTQTTKKRRLYIAALKGNTMHNAECSNLDVESFNSCFYYGLNYSEYIRCLYGYDNDFSVYKGNFTDGSEDINTLTLFHDKNLLKRKSFFQLGITEEEYNNAIDSLPENADNIFFYLEEISFWWQPWGNNTARKFKLGLSYEKNDGTIGTCFPTTDIFIYTIDGYYFFSKEYSDYQYFYSEFADAKVEFRPLPGNYLYTKPDGSIIQIPEYNGEFGFDWLRIGDNLNTTDDPEYSDIIINGYERPKIGDLNTEYESKYEAFKALKQEYFSLPAQAGNDYYVIPYLTLFSKEVHDRMISTHNLPYEADLRVLVEINANLNKLEFDYDTSFFAITINNPNNTQKNILSDKNICAKGESIDKTVKITCLQDFATSQLIKIWAYPAGVTDKKQAKLAGAIFVNKNDVTTRKTLDIALIKVKTDIDNDSATEDGSFSPDEKTNLKNTLHQFLIIENIVETPAFDLTSDTDFKLPGIAPFTPGDAYGFAIYISIYSPCNILSHHTISGEKVHDALANKFLPTNPGYNKYFLVFAFGIPSYNPNLLGEVSDIGVYNVVLYAPHLSDACTLNHETMHGLGLYHTHRDSTPIIEPEKNIFILI
jgi:hypothetical protein